MASIVAGILLEVFLELWPLNRFFFFRGGGEGGGAKRGDLGKKSSLEIFDAGSRHRRSRASPLAW